MPDPCSLCGACCYFVRGPVVEEWKRENRLLPDGSCKFYDKWLKRCKDYENRPNTCRMERTCPKGMPLDDWYDFMSRYCDDQHEYVFGVPRERRGPGGVLPECQHIHNVLELQLELSAACNAKCHFCPYPTAANDHRRGKFMDEDLLRKIIDESSTIPQIVQYALNGLGESTFYPRLAEWIHYIRLLNPHARLIMHTNGTRVDPQALRDAGLDLLVFSLNAVNAKQHERVMGLKGKYDQVLANIEKAKKVKGLTVRVRAIYSQDLFTEEDVATFRFRWGELAQTVYETNWLGLNRTQRLPMDENEGCIRALTQIYVAYNGDVHMCCVDALGKIVFGNLKNQTIKEVYNSEKYVKFRTAHAENRALDVIECKGCTRC